MRKIISAGITILRFLASLTMAAPLWAQTAATVTTNAGGYSPGSLVEAVSIINNQGPGVIDFQFTGSGSITLSTAAPLSLTQSVTFQGLPASVIGQDTTQASLLFQQTLTQDTGTFLSLSNNGANSSGLDASVTAQSWNLYSTAGASITGGNGLGIVAAGSNGAAGGGGGQASVATDSLALGGSSSFFAGGGTGGIGGTGDPGILGGAGGGGGSVSMAVGNLSLDLSSGMTVKGGVGGGGGSAAGGTGGAGGDGGSAALTADSVTLNAASLLSVQGGAGGLGGASDVNGSNGDEGGASVSLGALYGTGSLIISGNDASLQIGAGSYSGGINGNTGLEKIGGGALTLSGFNQYTGGTTITSGTLSVAGNGMLGPGSVLNNNGLNFLDNASAQNLILQNNGAVSFGGNATAGNAVITNNFYLIFGGNSNGGTASLTTNNFGTISFRGSSLGGSSNITVNPGGVFDMSSHTGDLSVGSIAGAGYFDLGANSLTTGLNNLDSAVSGYLHGTGGLTKIGTGVLTMSGSGDYSGGTLLTDGILVVGGSSPLGTGAVVVTGGLLETDGAGLTYGVGGNYSQGPLGKWRVGLGGAAAGSSDLMAITGSAALNGTLDLADFGGLTAPAVGQSVTVMTASAVSGRFTLVDQSFAGMRFLPLYHSDSLALLSVVPSFAAVALTANQGAVGLDLDKFFGDGREYDLMLGLAAQAPSALPASFDQISPEAFTAYSQAAFQTAGLQSTFASQRLEQLRAQRSGRKLFSWEKKGEWPRFAADLSPAAEASMAPAPAGDGWEVFLNSSGGFLNVSDDGNAVGYKITTLGVTGAGMDRRFGENLAAGLLLGYGRSTISPGGGGNLTANGGQAGLYGTWFSGIFYADLFAMGGLNQYQSTRASFGGTASGSTQGTQYGGSLLIGCQWKKSEMTFGPWAQVQWTQVHWDAFSESGSLAPLTLAAQTADSVLGKAGMKAGGRWESGGLVWFPSLSAAWVSEFNDKGGSIQAGLGRGDSFTVAGPLVGQRGVAIGAGLGVGFSEDLQINLSYQGLLARTNLDSQQFSGALSLGI